MVSQRCRPLDRQHRALWRLVSESERAHPEGVCVHSQSWRNPLVWRVNNDSTITRGLFGGWKRRADTTARDTGGERSRWIPSRSRPLAVPRTHRCPPSRDTVTVAPGITPALCNRANRSESNWAGSPRRRNTPTRSPSVTKSVARTTPTRNPSAATPPSSSSAGIGLP